MDYQCMGYFFMNDFVQAWDCQRCIFFSMHNFVMNDFVQAEMHNFITALCTISGTLSGRTA